MRATTLEINWHKKQAIHALDATQFEEKSNALRIATGGVDYMVRLWVISCDDKGRSSVEHRATLNRHDRGVGCVRFCPVRRDDKILLASAADDSIIIIWRYESGRAPMQMLGDGEEDEKSKECWTTLHTLRGHIEDVSDLSWSADGSRLASSGIDHSVIIWDAKEGKKVAMCQNHSHYVQGVALDPFGVLAASLSADRSLRFYTEQLKKGKDRFKSSSVVNKIQPAGYCRPVRMWWDDTLPGFVRRLSWSPDGLILAAPSGEVLPPPAPLAKDENEPISEREGTAKAEIADKKVQKTNCICIFTRGNRRDPALMLVSPEPTMIVRWCPTLFTLRTTDAAHAKTFVALPYRMVFAVATTDSVIVYETQTFTPCAKITDLHYANMTDLAWSHDGRVLFVSSRDGYVTRVDFAENELGEEYEIPLDSVRSDIRSRMNETGGAVPEEQKEKTEPHPDRLSPQLEKMKIKAAPKSDTSTTKAKKRVPVTTINMDDDKSAPERKVKKKVAIKTISTLPQ